MDRGYLFMGTKIFLIRHGQTDGNAKRQYCGLLDMELNEQGRFQAQRLALRLKKEAIHKVYASDRKRAMQSARIIFSGCRINRVPELKEINFGIFEGKSHQEIMESHQALYEQWLADPYNTLVPQGEGLDDFKARVTGALDKIVRANLNKTTAVVCHGGTISIILSHINGSRDFWNLIPKSTSLNIIEYANNQAKIALFNDITHLNV